MKRKIYICLFVLGALLLLTSCGAGAPNEKTLTEQLPASALQFELDDSQYSSSITSLTIEKQKTDKTEDIAYCKVICESDVLDRELFLCIHSSYTRKDGWTIDSCEEYQAPQIHLKTVPITFEDGQQLITNQGYTIQTSIDHSDLFGGFYNYEYVIHEDHKNLTVDGSASVTGSIVLDAPNQYHWVNDVSTSNVSMNWKVAGTWKIRTLFNGYERNWIFQNDGDSYTFSASDASEAKTSVVEVTERGTSIDDAELYIRVKIYIAKYGDLSFHNLFIQPDSAYCIFWAGAQGSAERISD